jgi:hypothetical protein
LQTRFALWLTGGVLASTLLLSGCADGVDLNGKVFDWMGISPAAQDSRRFEPRIAERTPLVVPPDVNRLPEPGSEAVPAPVVAWPDDPEQRRIREAQERERLHLAYCRGDAQWKERALNKEANAPRSPFGPCPSLFGNVTTPINKN